ncbi:MAG: 3-carboxy-cis,cis-muconate cycloisomerase [Solirubrobacterales bacterium]|nr:3-carboxy-cis,cis-muconate cycloisomerase [Solirubrobacterales bacterium]
MSAHTGENGLFAGLFARGRAAPETGDQAFLQAMLDVELALTRALADAGLAASDAPEEVAAACDAADFDIAAIGRSTGEKGTPVPGVLSQLRDRLSDAAAADVHKGATSQDILDTAMMLVARRALAAIIEDLAAAADACAGLADAHRRTLAPGRTLLQQALPLTFGLKAAEWLAGLDGARAELSEVDERTLAVQLGGAVGTLALYGERGLEIVAGVAAQLELAEPGLPWHTVRLRPARLAGALGSVLGVIGKVARDVILLAQTEVGEVIEGGGEGRGGSSTMPHKRNPVGAVASLACAQRAPGLVATILGAMVQEHERAAGAWQAEWEPMLELLRLAGSGAAAIGESLAGLEIAGEKMLADLGLTGSLLMSESVAGALGDWVGRPAAQQLVERAARRSVEQSRPFRDVLLEVPEIEDSLGADGVERALDPSHYLGVTDQLIDRALAAHRGG